MAAGLKMNKMLLFAVAFIGLGALILWMAGGIQTTTTSSVEPIHYELASPSTRTSTSITVATWNVAWGFGWGSEGSKHPSGKTKAQLEASLVQMGESLRSLGADIVLLQEVDFDAGRSKHLDEGRILSEASGLPYFAPAVSWRANYVPFPYWPPSAHFGSMKSGGGILSRFPIVSCEVHLLDKPDENPSWYNLFYLFRYAQRCEIDVDGQAVEIVNMHLEAFRPKNRVDQAHHVASLIETATAERTIFGGDLNAAPPEASVAHGYPDEPHTDHRSDETLATFRQIPGFRPALDPSIMRANEAEYFTFPAHAPNRTLDHLFVSDGINVERVWVPHEVGDPSDHLPVLARIHW